MSKSKKGKSAYWNKKYGSDHHLFGKKLSEEVKGKMKKPIIQISKDGIIIDEWKGVSDASCSTGINVGNINKVCKGVRKTAGGYVWRYK